MKKKISIVLALVLVFSAFASYIPTQATDGEAWNTDRYDNVIDVGIHLRELDNDPAFQEQAKEIIKNNAEGINFDEESNTDSTTEDGGFTFDGGSRYFLDYELGFKKFTLRSIGENVEVWVANDLSYGYDKPADVVTQEQADLLRDEFDSSIYPTDTSFFGMHDSHDGDESVLSLYGYVPENYYVPADGIERVIMLVDNIKDESYYNPDYPFYVAGFYWGKLEQYIDRNIITIDTNRWDAKMPNDNPDYEKYQYSVYGTVAHEFQHLIHADNDSGEETFINEGMSDYAEYLCGYGHAWGHVNYFLDHPENSLVHWGDYNETEILSDYGQAYLLQLYLNEQYGQEFIRDLAKDTDHGMYSIEKILDQYNAGIDFEELFRRFSIAVAIDSPEPGNGIYNFETIDLAVNYEAALDNDKDGVAAWGADYKVLDNSEKLRTIILDGIDYLATPWTVVNDPLGSEEKVLWGNQGDELQNRAIIEADLTNVETATLNFDNFVYIEESWDYGMVQVSTDNGNTWTSLANENTRSDVVPEGYPDIKTSVPGFTGYYENWINETFDLTPYAGQKILVTFNYMTDWGYNDAGWFIDNIEIPEIGYSNDCSTTEGLLSIQQVTDTPVEYSLVFINEKTNNGNDKRNIKVLNIDPLSITEEDVLQLQGFFNQGTNYMIVWYAAPEGNKDRVEFSYELIKKNELKK